jgi:hypothetical protein
VGKPYVARTKDVLRPVRWRLIFDHLERVVANLQVGNLDLRPANAGYGFDDLRIPVSREVTLNPRTSVKSGNVSSRLRTVKLV